MKSFTFQGNWEMPIQLDVFQEFQHAYQGTRQTDRNIILQIQEDEFSNDPDPSPQQLSAINYLLANETEIAQTLINHIFANYQNLVDWYDYDINEYDEEVEKPFKNDEQIKAIMRINTIYVLLEHKDGISYMGYSGSCAWDEEHGLGFTLHKTRVVDFGSSTESHSNIPNNECDNPMKIRYKHREPLSSFLLPHPKYNRFKPREKELIDAYALHLLSAGQTDDFIDCINQCEVYNHITDGIVQSSFISIALQTNNVKVLDFLIAKDNENVDLIMQMANTKATVEYLISRNIQLGSPYYGYETFWDKTLDRQLALLYNSLQEKSRDVALYTEYSQKIATFIKYLLKKGANPIILNNHFNRYYYNIDIKQEMKALLD